MVCFLGQVRKEPVSLSPRNHCRAPKENLLDFQVVNSDGRGVLVGAPGFQP